MADIAHRRRLALRPALVAAIMLLAGCTAVPTSSAPQTVEPIGGAGASTSAPVGPPPDADPRALVEGFLEANGVDAGSHANLYLTAAARSQWTDQAVTVISEESIGTYNAQRHVVVVTGRVLGNVDVSGVYAPQLTGDGSGGDKQSYAFGVTKVGGKNRISSLGKGLLLTADQFRTYHRQPLYFFDRANRYLVPDLRYSALNDPTELANWLVEQLVAGPREELVRGNSVNTDTLPGQARRAHVTLGPTSRIQVPGSPQLAAGVRNRLAAQLSATLESVARGGGLEIVDGSTPVFVPLAGGAVFTASDFPGLSGPPAPARPELYYLRGGRIRNDAGRAVTGPLGNASYSLRSIAMARPGSIGQLAVAAVQRLPRESRLVIGTQGGGLRPTAVHGQLCRPAWAPGQPEVWVGNGSQLLRVTTDGRTSSVTGVPIPAAAGGGRIVALRFSPDGSRIALVISGAHGSAQLYVGPVVRGGAARPQILFLAPISPDGVVLTDVAWLDSLHLFATGYLASSQEARIFDTEVDGSFWRARDISNLPAPPDSLTVTTDALAWVSTPGGFVWRQSGSSWVSPNESGQTPGTQPIYLT